MFRKISRIAGITVLAAGTMPADFSYQETTKITGGALVGMMKAVGVFSSQARQATQPIDSTVAVKGDRMVHRNSTHTTIIDLRSQTITSIDMQRKTYSVMTFEEMKQAMERMQERMQQQKQPNGQAQMNFKVSVNPTGNTRQIDGAEAKEVMMKMEMESTDQKSGQTGSMVINVDTWTARGMSGYREVREFYRKMAERINWTPNGNMFMGRPDVAQGMAEVYKQSAALDGIPVLQLMTMGAAGSMPADGPPPADQQPAQQQQQSTRPSIGGALGGKFGLGRKKQDSQAQQPAQGDSSASGVLLEMTTERKGFSEAPVDGSMFEIPAGFKQVDSEMKRMK